VAFLKAVTGRGLTTSIALELTDLGIMRWDADRNCIVAMFGDSFSFGWGQDWRSPTLACFDADFNCIGTPIRGSIAAAPAQQLWEYGHNNPDFSTVLPCDFIRIGTTWHVAVMLTKGLGNETMTEFWQSQNLIDWTLSGFGFPHPASDPCTTMLSFDQFGDDIYIVGTHGLRRDGPIKMWKTLASAFPRGYWEPCGVIRDGRHGELCLRNVQGQAVLSFFNEAEYTQTALTVAHPEDDWGQANRLDYATGQDLPQLYGGYIAPGSKLDEPDGMTFMVSQWVTATNDPYHVVAYTGTLPAKGRKTEGEKVAFTENGWPGLPATEDMLNWIVVPGTNVKLQIQKGQPTQILTAFVADVNAYIETVRDSDTACYTRENSVPTSNHRSGTAIDIDWERHAFHVKGTFGEKLSPLRELLNWYEGTVFWGGDWTDPIDEMHFQMGYNTYNNPKTADFITRKIRADGFSTYKREQTMTETVVASATATEKVLQYNHSQQRVAQEKPWDCGPASCQIVMDGLSIQMSEDELIRALGTNEGGTNTVEQALPILNQRAGDGGKWVAQWMPNDPPRPDQVEALWHNVKNSIDSGRGCVLNFEVPSSNFPRGTRGSASPQYRGGKIWHYVACMGWADDGPGGRHLWIADPGFPPFDKGGYWMSLQQAATAIPPHAYAYYAPSVAPTMVRPAPQPAPQPNVRPTVQPTAVVAAPVGDLGEFWAEWSAIELSDPDSIAHVIRTAASNASPEVVHRARAVLAKVSRPALSAALVQVDPGLLKALIGAQT
jgi:hypothetical protein